MVVALQVFWPQATGLAAPRLWAISGMNIAEDVNELLAIVLLSWSYLWVVLLMSWVLASMAWSVVDCCDVVLFLQEHC